MTSPWPDPPQVPSAPRTTFPAASATLTVADLGCGHIGDELCDTSCDYWRGVALGEYPHPDTYVVTAAGVLPPHLPGLLPLTDPALRGAA